MAALVHLLCTWTVAVLAVASSQPAPGACVAAALLSCGAAALVGKLHPGMTQAFSAYPLRSPAVLVATPVEVAALGWLLGYWPQSVLVAAAAAVVFVLVCWPRTLLREHWSGAVGVTAAGVVVSSSAILLSSLPVGPRLDRAGRGSYARRDRGFRPWLRAPSWRAQPSPAPGTGGLAGPGRRVRGSLSGGFSRRADSARGYGGFCSHRSGSRSRSRSRGGDSPRGGPLRRVGRGDVRRSRVLVVGWWPWWARCRASRATVPLAIVVAVGAVATFAYGFRQEHDWLWWVAAVLGAMARWVLLADAEVTPVEAFSLPLAGLFFVVGVFGGRRRHPQVGS